MKTKLALEYIDNHLKELESQGQIKLIGVKRDSFENKKFYSDGVAYFVSPTSPSLDLKYLNNFFKTLTPAELLGNKESCRSLENAKFGIENKTMYFGLRCFLELIGKIKTIQVKSVKFTDAQQGNFLKKYISSNQHLDAMVVDENASYIESNKEENYEILTRIRAFPSEKYAKFVFNSQPKISTYEDIYPWYCSLELLKGHVMNNSSLEKTLEESK